MLTLMIVLIMCILLALPAHPRIPAHLMYLLLIGITQFFASVGTRERVAGEPGPLGLPTGTLRLAVILVLVGVVVWRATSDIDGLINQIKESVLFMTRPEATEAGIFSPLFLPFLLLAGFFVGVLVHIVIGDHPPAFIQDIQAWLALVCLVGISIDAIINLIINPSLDVPLDLRRWNGVLSTVIAFYYGARS
jgi:uncharacterized membrane protein (DUF485 family)